MIARGPGFEYRSGPDNTAVRWSTFGLSTCMHCVHFARSLIFFDLRAQHSTTTGEIRSVPEDRPYNAIAHLLYYSDILYLSSQLLFLSLTFLDFRAIPTQLAFVHRLLGGDQWMDLGQIGIETVTYVRERRCNFG